MSKSEPTLHRAADRLRESRRRQPAKELLRKHVKSRRRGFFTQEGLDYADSIARELCRKLTP